MVFIAAEKVNFVKSYIHWLIIAVILLAGIGGFIAYKQLDASNKTEIPKNLLMVPVDRQTIFEKVGSTGKVRANQLVELNWQTSGTIGSVFVSTGDKVRTGDKIALLVDSSLQPSILNAVQSLPEAQRELENLKVSDQKRSQAQLDLAEAKRAYQYALDELELKNERNANDTNLLEAEAVYLTAKSNLKKTETFYSFMQDRPEEDVARAQAAAQLSAMQKQYNWALWNFQWAQNKPLPEDIRIAQANLNVAQAKVSDAERAWEKVKNVPDPDDIATAQAKVDGLQAQINLATIIAPFDGMISRADNQIGDLVRPGVSAAQLVDLSHLYLDISISEIDINKIKIGQEVQISFDAIPEEMYKGEVSEISKVGESIQEVINYIVTCEIINPNESIRPGMTAAVTINVDKVENVLTVLNRAVRSDGTSRYVNVVRNNTIIKIPITLGMITEDRSEVIAGDISEGDMVITNPQSIPTIEAVE